MKRLTLLLTLLLLAAPALAESLSLEDRYSLCTIPESTVLLQVQTEDGAVYLVRSRDGSRHLECWGADGGATVTSTPVPEGALLRTSEFGDAQLVFPHPQHGRLTVTLHHRNDGSWHIRELAEDCGFRWMYAGGALITESADAAIGLPGFETDVTKADWLSLPGTFEAAVGMLDAGDAPAQVCTILVYTLEESSAVFLLQKPDGTTVLAVSERTEEGWQAIYSKPLPEGTDWMDADGERITLYLPQGRAVLVRQPDGDGWALRLYDSVVIFGDYLWFNAAFGFSGPLYADVTLDTDITRIDWNTLPRTLADWLAVTDASSWGVVTGASATLYAPYGDYINEYLPGTPVRVLDTRGGKVRVGIAGGAVTGWMDASALLIGQEQLTLAADGSASLRESGFFWGVNCVVPKADAIFYDAPSGSPIDGQTFRDGSWVQVLAQYDGGWLHIAALTEDGFVRVEDCVSIAEANEPDND